MGNVWTFQSGTFRWEFGTHSCIPNLVTVGTTLQKPRPKPQCLGSKSFQTSLEVDAVKGATWVNEMKKATMDIMICEQLPFMVFCTFCSNTLRFAWSSIAASLFKGSSGLGSWNSKKYYTNQRLTNVELKYQNQGTHQEEILKAIDYGVDCQHRFPVLEDSKSNNTTNLNVLYIHYFETFATSEK